MTAVSAVSGDIPLALHLHDTRGLGLVNLMKAMACGVARFDTSFGGMGGCPFVKGAAGNIATEDTVYLLASLGIATGIAIEQVAACSHRMAAFLGKPRFHLVRAVKRRIAVKPQEKATL